MVPGRSGDTRWRATGTFLPTNALRQALVGETRQFLLALGRTGDVAEACSAMMVGELSQRSFHSRNDIVKAIKMRLLAWNPPSWVLADLISFARDDEQTSVQAALLLHLARQDALLYDLVQQVIVPRWKSGERVVARGDVQRFLDQAEPEHPEIGRWSFATRHKLAGNSLTILRDYGLLRGAEHSRTERQIVEPVVPSEVAHHLARLLRAEGVSGEQVPEHPDWRIWLWDRQRAASVCADAGLATEGTG